MNDGWFRDVVLSEIRPLLEEYWVDRSDKGAKYVKHLLSEKEAAGIDVAGARE